LAAEPRPSPNTDFESRRRTGRQFSVNFAGDHHRNGRNVCWETLWVGPGEDISLNKIGQRPSEALDLTNTATLVLWIFLMYCTVSTTFGRCLTSQINLNSIKPLD
jgi:hypothetical protein